MKVKCNWVGVSKGGYTSFQIHPDDHGVFLHDMSQYNDKDLLTIEVKKYKPLRTLSQNAFFHKTVAYLAFKLGMDAEFVKEGIKDLYGYRMKVYQGSLIPKPSHLCNKFEEMNALIEGCFREAGEQQIDMRDYIQKWEEFKKDKDKTLDKKA